MMRGYMITGFILLLPGLSLANAGEQTRIYDAHGRNIGAAVPQGEGSIRYYDARGKSVGTSTRTGNTTRFYDAHGRLTGSSTEK
jgi:YD repeat-containing protein